MKVLIFDIEAPFAHFKVPYTTSSPLTYPIPTKTAIAGMIAGIIGLDKSDYTKYFTINNFQLAIRILNPIKTIHINENFINVKEVPDFHQWKKGKNPRTQINIEFIKDCAYRLFIWHKDNKIYFTLKENLERHQSYYSLCMGLSECLSNFKFICESELIEKVSVDTEINISSVIPLSQLKNNLSQIVFGHENRKYLKVHIPIELSEKRELTKSEEILFERDGKEIYLTNIKYYEVMADNKNENIMIF